MYHSVAKFGKFAAVPPVSGAHEISCDTLYRLKRCAALRALMLIGVGILISAERAVVSVMVDRAVSDIVFVHEVYNLADGLGIVCRISIDLHVEDMSSACEFVVRRLNLGFMSRRAAVIDRHMVGVGVIIFVGNSGYHSEGGSVALGESPRKSFSRGREYRIIM